MISTMEPNEQQAVARSSESSASASSQVAAPFGAGLLEASASDNVGGSTDRAIDTVLVLENSSGSSSRRRRAGGEVSSRDSTAAPTAEVEASPKSSSASVVTPQESSSAAPSEKVSSVESETDEDASPARKKVSRRRSGSAVSSRLGGTRSRRVRRSSPENAADTTEETESATVDVPRPEHDGASDHDTHVAIREDSGAEDSGRDVSSEGAAREEPASSSEEEFVAQAPGAEGERPKRTRSRSRGRRSRGSRQRGRGRGEGSTERPAVRSEGSTERPAVRSLDEADTPDLPEWVESADGLPQRGSRRGSGRQEVMTTTHREPSELDEAEAEKRTPKRKSRTATSQRILVNSADPEEVRIAVVTDGRLDELYYDRPDEKRFLGNIYKGRIVNLEPGIQAAFVEIGIGRNGFLHVSDVLPAYKDADGIPIDSMSKRIPDRRRLKIQDILREGQEVLVQISKDAIGAKGPSLTTYVSIPGKYLVLMPGMNRFGVSKKIEGHEHRSHLRKALANLNPPKGVGYIVRTASHEGGQAEFENDFAYLMKVWDELCAKVKSGDAPRTVYAESDLIIRTMRDLFGPEVGEILVDDEQVYTKAREFCLEVHPEAVTRLKRYTGVTPIFSRFGVEDEIEMIYNRKVPLPSGGHIVVEQTEALVAIDVNSGKYRDEEDLEATALKTNLEAAAEIARQLRLRDLGGVIINDFIDMERESNRREVERAFREALRGERAKCWLTRISRFGIIEMTRQRLRPSFERAHYEPCACCRGTGVVKTARSVGTAILRQICSGLALKRRRTCEITAEGRVSEYLLNDRRGYVAELERKYKKNVVIKTDASLGTDQYVVRYY